MEFIVQLFILNIFTRLDGEGIFYLTLNAAARHTNLTLNYCTPKIIINMFTD